MGKIISIRVWNRDTPERFSSYNIDRDGEFSIGTEYDNFIVINDKFASRHHGSIIRQGQKILLKDEDSINGIMLFRDGEPFALHSGIRRLIHEDVLTIGKYIFLIKEADETSTEKELSIGHGDYVPLRDGNREHAGLSPFGAQTIPDVISSAPFPNLERKSFILEIINKLFRKKERNPTRRSLRLLIENILIIESDFDAFVLDNFPEIKRRFSSGMDRVSKINQLLELAGRTRILERLQVEHPDLFQAVSGIVEYE